MTAGTEHNLKTRQQCAAAVAVKLQTFLLDFQAMQDLSIGDMKIIAERARMFAFDELDFYESERVNG